MDKETIFMTYLMEALFEQTPGAQSPNILTWMVATMQPNSGQNQTSKLAISALAATYFGKLHSCQSAIERGAVLYTNVLSKIRDDLHDPVRLLETSTLANTLFLAVYELVTFKDITAWLTHFVGLGQLVCHIQDRRIA